MSDDDQLVDQMLDELATIPPRLVPFLKDLTAPAPESPAAQEQTALGENKSALAILDYGPNRARLALDVSADALQALSRVLRPPPHKLAPGGVARDVLESAAFATWLVGPVADEHERIDRVGRVYWSDRQTELKLSKAGLAEAPGSEEVQAAVEWAEEQITLLEEQLRSAGTRPKPMIPSTELSGRMLGSEYEYRLYSGLSHGAPVAINAVRGMYNARDPQAVGTVFSYIMHPAADAYCRAVWSYAVYMGLTKMESLQETLENVYESLHFSDDPRTFFREFS